MRGRWLLLLVLVGWLAPAAAEQSMDCSNASPDEAKRLMLKAAAQVAELGYRRAFENFMDPEGEFFPRDLYVFVVDAQGRMWVNGAYPQAIGTNALDAEDAKGRRYIEQMLQIAEERGEGRIEYQWFNPCNGEYMNKVTFFKRVDRFVIAVGAYGNISVRPGGAAPVQLSDSRG